MPFPTAGGRSSSYAGDLISVAITVQGFKLPIGMAATCRFSSVDLIADAFVVIDITASNFIVNFLLHDTTTLFIE